MGAKRVTLDEIKNRCQQAKLEYISHYQNDKGTTMVVAKCQCGEEFEITLKNVSGAAKNGRSCICRKCVNKKIGKAHEGKKHTQEHINKAKENRTVLKGENHPMYGKHHTKEWKQNMSKKMQGNQHLKGKHPSDETRQKLSETSKKVWQDEDYKQRMRAQRKGKFTKEKNPMWNPNKTDEERKYQRGYFHEGYNDWKQQVKEQANFTCDICGQRGGRLHAHHLNDYHTHKELATDINNGVCLCEHCHKEFHSWMGGNRAECTEQDYLEFKQMKQEQLNSENDTNSNVA